MPQRRKMFFDLVKRFGPPGGQPGDIRPDREVEPLPEIKLVLYDQETYEEQRIESFEQVPPVKEGTMQWVVVEGHHVPTLKGLSERFGVHSLVVEDIYHVGQRPKIESHDDFVFIILDFFARSEPTGEITKEQISHLVFEGRVITVLEGTDRVYEPVRERLRRQQGRIRSAGSDYLAYALIDAVVDHLFPVIDALEDQIEEVDSGLLQSFHERYLQQLHRIRHSLLVLRRSARPTREMIGGLLRADHPLITKDTLPFLRDVHDHAVQSLELVESYRDMASSLIDLYMSTLSNRMNEVMKVLTLIATIFIPLSFIAGVYGMNFDTGASPWNMPELGWGYGYPAALGLMGVVAASLLLYFRSKRWL